MDPKIQNSKMPSNVLKNHGGPKDQNSDMYILVKYWYKTKIAKMYPMNSK